MDDDLVANFVAITGATDTQAIQMLEATNFSLEEAVDLFFAAGGEVGGAPAAAAPPPSLRAHEDDEAFARRLQQEANAAPGPLEDDQVRAPIPTKVDRLYGDNFHAPARPAASYRPAVPANVVDAFRDFRAEGDAGAGGSGSNRLASMFEPPRDLIFHGSFEDAKAHATEHGKWLIVNLQSTSQFASHQLNRDTWRDATVHALVESSFVLFQAYDVTDEGQKLLSFYHAYEIPATLVLDPVTGAPMRHWTGFLAPDRMIDNLTPFLDTSFSDPGAARLAASLKRKKSGFSSAQPGGSGGGGARTEDEELQAALAASLQEGRGGGGGAAAAAARAAAQQQGGAVQEEEMVEVEDEDEVEEIPSGPSPEEVVAEALARLPAEPAGADGCPIAVRFPDGSRKQRRFPKIALLRSVHDWCLTLSMEAAGGRPFYLSEGTPGAPALNDLEQTLEGAGVAGAMLVMKWND